MVNDVYMAPKRPMLAATVRAEVDLRAIVKYPAPAGYEVAVSRNEVGIGGNGCERARERQRYRDEGVDRSLHCCSSRWIFHGFTSRLSRIRRPRRSSRPGISRVGR